MKRLGFICLVLLPLCCFADEHTGSDIGENLRHTGIDPQQVYRVRDLELVRGDLKIYLTEGVLAFASPVRGKSTAAVFTTAFSEGGDAEVLLLPPNASERSSLASFTHSPNLDEHFHSAVFMFSDRTKEEVLHRLGEAPNRISPDQVSQFAESADPVLRSAVSLVELPLIESLLDKHPESDGFFYAFIAGSQLGTFELAYRPIEFEPITVGQLAASGSDPNRFRLWSSFRPRHAPEFVPRSPRIHDYLLDSKIGDDLSLSVDATFDFDVLPSDGRVISLDLSPKLTVDSAAIDGNPAEVFQGAATDLSGPNRSTTFLVIAPDVLAAGTRHSVTVRYHGSVIRRAEHGYFVDERTSWYPRAGDTLAAFDLKFECPAKMHLVSTGEPISDQVSGGIRTVHRKTLIPEGLAGFNIGEYALTSLDRPPYTIDCYFERSLAAVADAQLPLEAAKILEMYSREWMPLPIRHVAISPISGYFGQGFPGLVYLSEVSYVAEQNRPTQLRNARLDTFFSDLLLPHELAHQWWGNIARSANYRSAWLMEAMSNDAALDYLAQTKGSDAVKSVLDQFRTELTKVVDGKTVESAGPIDFGERLTNTAGLSAWHSITYEKGAWILRMLRARLGEESFHKLQLSLLHQFASKPATNEDFRRLAAGFVPAGDPDRTLANFFDTWVYGTGIPTLKLSRESREADLEVSGVTDDFTAEIPLSCHSRTGAQQSFWVHAVSGSNTVRIPEGLSSCQLPPSNAYLYLQ